MYVSEWETSVISILKPRRKANLGGVKNALAPVVQYTPDDNFGKISGGEMLKSGVEINQN